MKRTLIIASLFALGLATSANAASTRNITPNNIGPAPTPNRCIAVTLAGSTYVRICNGGYTAQLGGTRCQGGAWGNGNYQLSAGSCNNGQQFLGGRLSCNGTICQWTPSPAGFAAGFRSEQVYAQYQ